VTDATGQEGGSAEQDFSPAGQDTSSAGRDGASAENAVSLRLTAGPLAGPVLCRVLSMVLARADWPADRLHDALLICDAIIAHAPVHTQDGRLNLTVSSGPRGVELHVEALAERGAHELLSDATVPGVGNVLERMSSELCVVADEGSGEKLVLTLSHE
jgi:hypothetical protein